MGLWVVGRVAFIGLKASRAGTGPVAPIANYLIKRKVTQFVLAPTVEGLAIALFDQRNVIDAKRFRDLRKVKAPKPRGGLFPTTDEAIDAWESAIRAQGKVSGIAVQQRAAPLIRAIRRGGLTPLVPVINRQVRDHVALNLGVPRWLILSAGTLGRIF